MGRSDSLALAAAVLATCAQAAAPPPPPQSACVPPHHNFSFCNASLPLAQRAALLVSLMTVEELVSQTVNSMAAIPRLGIRQNYIYGTEALHGIAAECPIPGPSGRCFTSFATSSAAAASFNRTLWFRVGQAQGREARWAYDHGYLAGLHLRGPQLNPQRDPRWGRCDNSPGESAYVNGEFGVQMVLGGQGALPNGTYPHGEYRNAIHEVKHFAAYSVEDGRNEKGDTWDISLRDLSEYYFAPLRACVEKADVGAYMCSYDAVNGTASCGNEWMLSTVVRSHWGFEGVVESDCGAVEGISSHMHGGWSSATMEVAVAAMNATVSIDCGVVGPKNAYTRNLRAAVDQKLISRAQLEMAVARVYKGRFAIGEFDVHSTLYKGLPDDTIFSAAHRQLSLETAQQSLVLLRNNNNSGAAKLPLRPGLKIAIIGPNGNSSHIFQGSYHGANCPNDGEISGAQVRDESCLPSALDEIIARNAVGGGTTTFVSGCSGPTWAEANNNKANAKNKDHMPGQTLCKNLVNISQVNATVAAADVVILAVGLALQVTSAEETDRAHSAAGYALPGKQLELCKLVRELGKPTVVLHFAGMAVGMDWLAEQYDWPLLVPGYGGRFGPVAVAAALFGEFSPTGKLPYTVYKEDWAAKTPMADMSLTAGDGRTYKWLGFENASIAPSFAFGTGTSYSTFGVSVRKISVSARAAEQSERYSGVARGALPPVASFSIATTNHGVVAASDATLVFVAPTANISTQAPRPLPKKQLVEFVRTPVLEPGATHRDVVHLHEEAFAMADWRGWSTAYSGTYQVLFDNGDGQTSAHEVTIAEHAVLDVMPAPPAVKSGGV